MAKFSRFALSEKLLETITSLGYCDLTPIQEMIIPLALRGESVIARSPTGSGKTHAFLVPIFEKIDTSKEEIQVLILSPTRELAKQTLTFARAMAKSYPDLRLLLLAGGEEKKRNMEALERKPHIIIATPGRLKDLGLENTVTSLISVKTVVLDEADMLFDSGFFPIINEILTALDSFQIMVFSATFSENLKNSLAKHFPDMRILECEEAANPKAITHYLIDTRHRDSYQAVLDFIIWKQPYFLLIFASRKKDVDALYRFLLENNLKVGVIHGNLSDRQRKQMMRRINHDEFSVIVASDMAARGLDFEHISEVLNFDLPNNLEYYFHRAGRTGRYKNQGEVYSFYDRDHEVKPRKLIAQAVDFTFLIYQDGKFIPDANPRLKKKVSQRKVEDQELSVAIKKAVAETRTKKVKPNYKKKVRVAVEKTKRKHRREIIRKDIRRQREERYRKEARERHE
ncbi:MAG: DEAD/DEAH box helicase [Bacilli bacterium]